MESDVTLGELARRMDLLHTDVKELRQAVVQHDDLRSVTLGWERALQAHETLAFSKLATVESRVSALETWQTWVVRIVVGLVLVAGVGLVIQAGKSAAESATSPQKNQKAAVTTHR